MLMRATKTLTFAKGSHDRFVSDYLRRECGLLLDFSGPVLTLYAEIFQLPAQIEETVAGS
jgi:hypothetical protein